MSGPVSENLAASTEVFDPCFIQTIELGTKNEVLASTVRTSREIVLTQQTTGVPVAKAVPVSKTESLTAYGDLVKVHGTINAPGRTIKVFCRRLEFHPGPDNTSGIVVSGERGADGEKLGNLAAASGQDGTGTPGRRHGEKGHDGADGKDGNPGNEGGRIEIYCDTFAPLTPVTLKAEGGRGGDGANGQQGGVGGGGLSGFTTEEERVSSYGGSGGQGGHGGNGGQGGKGGSITLYFMKLGGLCQTEDPATKHLALISVKDLVTVSVLGGAGGNGASAGKGGKGGDGGNAESGCVKGSSNVGYRFLGGADASCGGICGSPGYFGYSGSKGTVRLGVPVDVKPEERLSIAEVLEAGNWLGPEELQSMPADKQREALVDELNRIIYRNRPEKDEIDKLTDSKLVGRGAVTVFLLEMGLANEADLAGDREGGRNFLISAVAAKGGYDVGVLQGLDNQNLVKCALAPEPRNKFVLRGGMVFLRDRLYPIVFPNLAGIIGSVGGPVRSLARGTEISIAEVLEAGNWLRREELQSMSADKQREALIDRLSRISNPIKYLKDYDLIGHGAVTAFLLQMGIANQAGLEGDREGGRNALISAVAAKGGYDVGFLQGVDNQALVRLALRLAMPVEENDRMPQNNFVVRGGMLFLQDRLFGPFEMYLYDVLQAGNWLRADQLDTMSAPDQRQALVDQLSRIGNLPEDEINKLNDYDLVGYGAVTAFLLQMGIRDEAGLKCNPAEADPWKRTVDCLEGCRNTLIVEVGGKTGYLGNPQGLDNHQLVRTALEPKPQNKFVVRGGMVLLRDRLFGPSRMSRQLIQWDVRFSLSSPQETNLVKAVVGSITVVGPPDRPSCGRDGDPFPDPNERGTPGIPGKASVRRFISPYDPPIDPGKDGVVVFGSLQRERPKPPRNKEIPETPKVMAELQRLDYMSFASHRDMEQLEMLFQYVRTRYLLTNVQADSAGVASIMETLVWLVLVTLTGANDDKKLNVSAAGTLDNLRHARNVFGKDAEFAAMGSLQEYKDDLKTILDLFNTVQKTYAQLNKALKAVTERQAYLGNVITGQGTLIQGLRDAEKDTVKALNEAVAAIQTLDDARVDKAGSLGVLLNQLKVDTQTKGIGLSVADFCNLFTQLSFTAVEPSQKKGVTGALEGLEARGGLMLVGQFGDMFNKALNNVPTDTGASIDRKYVVRRLEFLGKDVKKVEDLKTARNGLIKTDPSKEYRLLATREQLQSILSNFYEQFPAAWQASQTFDEYIESVTARNAKVDEYNELLAQLCYVRGELDKTIEQQSHAETHLAQSTNPGLPAMARFSAALHTHALQNCVEQLYTASRVFTLQALNPYDVFADVLGQMTSTPGELNPAALDAGLIDIISRNLNEKQKHKTNRQDYTAMGDHCQVTLTGSKNPLLFKMLKAGKAGTFAILPAGKNTTIDRNPFARMSEVRITGIRCTANGMKTGDDVHTIEITHPGIETFCTEGDRSIRLNHNPVTVPCTYNAKLSGPVKFTALDEDHKMIGPFCSWILRIPNSSNKDLDLKGLQSITVEFEGKNYSFV